MENMINKVLTGDCLELLPLLPASCIDMVLCDLPYGTTQNPWDQVIDLPRLWQQYERIIKPQGVIVLTAHGIFTGRLIMSNTSWYRYKMVWIKSKAPNFLQANRQPLKKHEDICVFYKGSTLYQPQFEFGRSYKSGYRKNTNTGSYGHFKPAHIKKGALRYPTDVLFYEEDKIEDWVYFKTAEREGPIVHPTQKPVALARYLIRTFSKEDAIVLDNACGCGSFLVAAVLEGRRFIGMEKNESSFTGKIRPVDFVKVSEERVMAAFKQRQASMGSPPLL